MNKILVCTGFHRSASSVTARYLHNAGLPMGIHFMGGGISNFGGHYEDWPVVKMHDRLLEASDTNWQFHDEVVLPTQHSAPFLKYIQLRDQHGASWGFKDPRSILYLNEWDQALAERGRYLFLIRHWSSSIESLLRRHSRRLSHDLIPRDKRGIDFNFWSEPNLGPRMWLAYNARLLAFAEKKPEQCLIVTQRALFNDIPLIETLNEDFGLQLEQSSTTFFDPAQINDYASNNVNGIFSEGVREQLENTWSSLIKLAHFKAESELPMFIDAPSPNEGFIQQLKGINTNVLGFELHSQVSKNDETNSVCTLLQKIKYAKSPDEVSDLLHEDRIQQQKDQREDATSLIKLIDNNYKKSTHVNLAFAYWLKSKNEWLKAVEYFQWTIHLGVKLASTHINIAQCNESLGESELADESFKEAINLDPDNPLFLTIYGAFLRDIGKTDAALKYLKLGAELAKRNPSCVLPYCDFLEQSDQIDEAYALITKLADTNPNNLAVRNMLIRLSLKSDSVSGELMYKNMAKKQINAQDNRYEWLADISSSISSDSVQADFISRVGQHWGEIE